MKVLSLMERIYVIIRTSYSHEWTIRLIKKKEILKKITSIAIRQNSGFLTGIPHKDS